MEHVHLPGPGRNARLLHMANGTEIFGRVPNLRISSTLILPEGLIYLPQGRREFGAIHIFDRRRHEMAQRGLNGLPAVPAFVASILRPAAPIHAEGRKREKLAVVQSRSGTVILTLREPAGQAPHYTVTTAFLSHKVHGQRVGKLL